VKEFRELVLLLSKNLTLPVTYSSLQKAIGISNADSVREYLGFLSDAYMFYELRQFHHSFRKQLRNPRKIYLNDPAFHNLTGFNHSKNPGRKLENAVYLELRRKGMELYTFKGKGECDFVSFGSDRNITLIQVCYELHSENEKREVDGIVEAMNYFGLNSGIILTYDQERSISFEDRSIQILPVWKWMLVAE
jgi:predicted AAA+ superfamily ATPase